MPRADRRHFMQSMAALSAVAAWPTAPAWANETKPLGATRFPSRPIHIMVPFAAGSGSDETARFYGDLISKRLNVPVVVENRPGGSGAVAAGAVKTLPADGCTLLLASNSVMAVNPVVKKSLSYDPFKDFRPVHGLFTSGAVLVAPMEGPDKLADWIAKGKQSGKPMSIGNYSEGYQLLSTWLGHEAQLPITHVPYKGGSAMVSDVVGNRLDAGFNDASGVLSMVNGGKLRGLAITSAERDPKLPNVPTMLELGHAGFESYVWASLYVRAGTPDAITQTLASVMKDAMASPESLERAKTRPGQLLNLALDDMGQFQRREFERFQKVAQAAGVQPS